LVDDDGGNSVSLNTNSLSVTDDFTCESGGNTITTSANDNTLQMTNRRLKIVNPPTDTAFTNTISQLSSFNSFDYLVEGNVSGFDGVYIGMFRDTTNVESVLAIGINGTGANPKIGFAVDNAGDCYVGNDLYVDGNLSLGALTDVESSITTNTTNITTNTGNITTNTTNITTINNTLSGYTYTSGTDTTKINNNFEIGSSTTSKTVSINGSSIETLIDDRLPTALSNGGLAVNASNEFSLDFTNLNAGISIPQDITMTSNADVDINDGKTTLRDGGRQLLIVDFDKNSSSTGTWGNNSYFNIVSNQLRIGDAFYYSNNPNNGQFKVIGNGTYRISVKCSAENVSFGDRVCVGLYVSINGDTGGGTWREQTDSGKFGMMYLRFDNYGFAGNMFFEDYYELSANDYVSIKTKLGEGSDNRNWNDSQNDAGINLYTHMEIEKISQSTTILVSGNN
jgi:hypothetical protein